MTRFSERHGKPIIDNDPEPFIYHGEELTDDRAEQVAADSLAEVRLRNLRPGRKSLSGGDEHSPTLQFRVPRDLVDELDERAETEGTTRSTLARKALEQYLHGKAS